MSATRRDVARSQAPTDDPGSVASLIESPDDEMVPAVLVVVALLAAAVGVVARFVAPSGLWLDEALSVNIAKLPLGELTEALRQDGHPPLYYVVLHAWMAVVGDSDGAVRALSGVVSVASLPLAYLVGRRRGGRRLGLVVLALFALAPFALRYATETRMYALVMALVFVGYLLVDDITRRGRDGWGRVLLLAVVTAALLWSHYWCLWLGAGTAMCLAMVWRRSGTPVQRRGIARALLGLATGALLFVPWLPVLLDQARHTGTPWSGPVRPTSLLGNTLTDFGGGDFKDAQFVGAVLLVLVVLGVFARATSNRTIEIDIRTVPQFRVEAAVVVATIGTGLLVSYLTWSAYVTRYAAVVLPIVVLVAAAGVTRFADRWVQLGVLVAVLGLFSIGGVYNLRTERTQAAALATQMTQRARPGDVVVTCPDQLGPSVARAFGPDLDIVTYPDLGPPARVDWRDYLARHDAVQPEQVADRLIARAASGHGLFVVWSSGYKTHRNTCEALLDALGRRRPRQDIQTEDGDRYFEHANLTWFPATS